MSVIIVKDDKTALSVKPGDAYFIDVFPPPEDEEQLITDEMLAEADRLEQVIRDNIAEPVEEPKPVKTPSKSALNKMKEADVVKLANDMGIDASVDDKKSDTIKRILGT